MRVIDAQIHLWARETSNRRWPEYGRSYAHGQELLAEQVISRMDEAGVDAAILVPPSWEGDRNDVCLDAAIRYPDRFAVMGRFPIEVATERDQLETWRQQTGMLGVRLTFHNRFQKAWLRDGTADWFWSEAERLQIPLMLFVPDSLDEIAGIAKRFPGLKLILDHLALFGTYDDQLIPQLDPTLALARFPNIAVKSSCMPNLVSEDYPFPTLVEAIQRVVGVFGPERTFWGSDVSRLRCSWRESRALFTDECSFLSSGDLEWIMGRGIREWLRWE
ncbi:MAG: amidohydrolase family protein [Pseudomonadota bacterium]|uniref:Amidohydrolase-related domain-containing protein n=1 Tax=marine metagenome TaxID=408172 RepID=A0A381PJ88_9ZZZZ|nr:amidohydrolase family protein [Pseudomonadota bacterium]MEC8868959.1 amidohydrolase family protein [Pseudomonadota bacterium]MEC9284507.1 amidohydrolase family protein [Pseudomonadota bacterium]MEE3182799.1 amidohydrolase family protein [Pseudomonadota bacterium]HBP14751.1 hypothetical protein [Gammaproteobacteria bacterium]|tara:strand:- start:2085 stop:2909 length:825 start_codon:yes stop_codon:yes gene_type:complete